MRTLGAAAGLQFATVVGAIISMPIVTRTLDSGAYGVFVTVTSLAAVFGFADLGVSSALAGRLARLDRSQDGSDTLSVVSSALFALIAAALIALVAGVLAVLIVPWQTVLGTSTIDPGQLRLCVLVFVISTAVSIVGSLGRGALYGIQRGGAANAWLALAALLGAAATIVAAAVDGPLWTYVVGSVGVPAATSLACSVWALQTRSLKLRPTLRARNRDEVRTLFRTGGWFSAITVAGAIGYQSDALIVSSVLGAAVAGVYSVGARVFGIVMQGLYPGLMHLWPAFIEAMEAKDWHWVWSRFWWSTILGGATAAVVSAFLVGVTPGVVRVWLTPALVPGHGLLIALAIWSTYSVASTPLFFMVNALGLLREHAVMAIAVAGANVCLSIFLANAMGVEGPVYGSLISSFAFSGIPAGVLVWRRMRPPLVVRERVHPPAT